MPNMTENVAVIGNLNVFSKKKKKKKKILTTKVTLLTDVTPFYGTMRFLYHVCGYVVHRVPEWYKLQYRGVKILFSFFVFLFFLIAT